MSPERRKLYPKGWSTISRNFRQSKNFTCADCGIKQGDIKVNTKTGEVKKAYVVASHEDHTQRHDPNAKLICRCPSCHLKADISYRKNNIEVQHQRRLHRVLLARRGG